MRVCQVAQLYDLQLRVLQNIGQGKGDTFMERSGHLKKEMANFEIRIKQGKNMSCSQGVHFQFIGDKVKNYVLPKNKIYVLP